MNKGIIAVIILIILAGGAFFLFQKNKSKSNSTSTPTAPTSAIKPTQSSGFSSIQDALSKSVSLKCEYPDPKDSSKNVSTYIKAGSVRVITGGTPANNVIVKDNKMYNWFEGKKEGTLITFDMEAMKDAAGKMHASVSVSPDHKINQKDAMIKQMEQYKKYCKQEAVADSFFEVPKDIKFLDFSAQMKQSGFDTTEMMQKMQGQFQKMPANPSPGQ